jgi:hypothetical protein
VKLFVYDDLLRYKLQLNIFIKNKIRIVSERIAETEGLLFVVDSKPIMIETSQRPNLDKLFSRRVFGAILEFDDKDSDKLISILDDYFFYSTPKKMVSYPYDLTYRKTIQCNPISFKTLDEFCNYDYKCQPAEDCITYFGVLSDSFDNKIRAYRGAKRKDGVYEGIGELFHRKNLIKRLY